jgi:hypothetical protein
MNCRIIVFLGLAVVLTVILPGGPGRAQAPASTAGEELSPAAGEPAQTNVQVPAVAPADDRAPMEKVGHAGKNFGAKTGEVCASAGKKTGKFFADFGKKTGHFFKNLFVKD